MSLLAKQQPTVGSGSHAGRLNAGNQPRGERGLQQRVAARTHDTGDLAQRGSFVRHMLKHMVAHHKVEVGVRKRNVGDIDPRHVRAGWHEVSAYVLVERRRR